MTHQQLQQVTAYFKDCLQADTRTLSIYNIFGARAECTQVFEGEEELASGAMPMVAVSRQWGQEVSRQLALHRDKQLYYCAFFIVGKLPALGTKNQKICAPLLLYPATIAQHDGNYFLEANLEKRTLNVNFLNLIKQPQATDMYSLFAEHLPRGPLDMAGCGTIKQLLDTNVDDVDAADVYLYPRLAAEPALKKKLHSNYLNKLNGFELVTAAGAVVLRQATQSGGLITELHQLAKAPQYSAPIQALYTNQQAKAQPLPSGLVPVVLNHAQATAINMVNNYALSMLSGPPGTGKSFTMAAIAAAYVSKGKSVLVVARTDQAVDVVAQKAAAMGLGQVLLRAGKKSFLSDLKRRLAQILGGVPPNWGLNKKLSNELAGNIDKLNQLIGLLEKQFETEVSAELDKGAYLARHGQASGLLHKLKKWYISRRNDSNTPLWALSEQLEKYLTQRTATIQQKLQADFQYQLWLTLKHNRADFQNYLKSLRARHSADQDRYLAQTHLPNVLKAYPLWLTKMADLSEVLPLQHQLFDLVIIDEATQSDIASALPAMQRAARAVVVGDPNQLRHMSFLAQTTQGALQNKHKVAAFEGITLDYRNDSILDAVSQSLQAQAQTTFLDEHFRSTPRIISFSNQHIYSNSMRIMTQVPRVVAHRSLFWLQVPNGRQDKKGHNPAEALAVIEAIQALVHEQASLPAGLCQSIGVLSPFRDQANHLSDLLLQHFTQEQVQKHNISCGTAHSFQGEERDVMLLSFTADDQSHPTSFRHMNRPDVFNVAITRARARQYLFTSFSTARLKPGSLLASYLAHVQQDADTQAPNQPVKDTFQAQVCEALQAMGAVTWQAFDVAGLEVDIIFKLNNARYGINLIGYPGQFEASFSLERYNILARAGLFMFPLPYSWWFFDRATCLKALTEFVNRHNQS